MNKFDKNKLELVGKIFRNNQGYEAEVIEYLGVDNIVIKFLEDSSIKIVAKCNLLKGVFRKEAPTSKIDKFFNDNYSKSLISKDGYSYQLKNKEDKKHINIEFEDGTNKCVDVRSLISGNILRFTNKEIYEGKIIENKQGVKAKILEYINIYKINIQFLDSSTKKSVSLVMIKNGTFKEECEKTYIDEVKDNFLDKYFNTKDTSHKYKIKDIISSNKIIVEFEDNTVRTYTAKDIVNNNIKYTYDKYNAIGKEFINYKGEKAKVIAYRKSTDVDLKFEDGELCTNVNLANVRRGYFVKK